MQSMNEILVQDDEIRPEADDLQVRLPTQQMAYKDIRIDSQETVPSKKSGVANSKATIKTEEIERIEARIKAGSKVAVSNSSRPFTRDQQMTESNNGN